ncbi:magnesium-translocating P-type ATPase [Mucilaginibacter sp. 44-25]|uniref:magnesium-translocating P-type ATPase n=1 Tax=Mucilaginibacter sp. 44-25 TaxID=1895794 RepID=UPI0009647D6D|nr:magnesium-translocating P-type ATPase [Mucilaginibacter sp. 44-25]OJW15886.1 MAG: magnesium-translocating P-type ATPase [Mucilaginibacter sp. 44-25]
MEALTDTSAKKKPKDFWHLIADEAFSSLASRSTGLTEAEALKKAKVFGPNSIKAAEHSSVLILFLSQFKSPVTLLLLGAAILSAALGDIPDTVIIFVIVLISSGLGFWQEKGAAKAVSELLKLVQLHCDVLRDGKKKSVTVEEVVPGDIILLSAGDIIPGDSLILQSQELFVDEAAFTGETYPVEKNAGILTVDTPLARRTNVVFMGSHVLSGKATVIAVNTGKNTEFGQISAALQFKAPETEFEKGIRKFGYMLMQITLLLVLLIFAINVFLHKPVLDSFMFSLALAIGLTPQLLPAIVSVNLSNGARRMAKQNVIVKRLSAIENLGSMNILCTDKTGTITEGKVNVKDSLDSNGKHSEKVLKYAWLNASLQQGFSNPIDKAICAAFKGDDAVYSVQAEIPYDFIRKRLTIQVRNGNESIAITKGALSLILSICAQVETGDGGITALAASKATILQQYDQLSKAGYRTLGVAYKKTDPSVDFTKAEEREMIFLGFITLFDPPKIKVADTLAELNTLGVKLKIITGDNALVAESVALQIGIKSPKIITGEAMMKMSSSALFHKAPLTDIFAEVQPDQKERIISVLKKAGHVVGFMGDGINDAPALHMADVGISVDTAVDVAKESADIVLLSRDLEVLTLGIKEGRKTFTNTMKYIFMSTSANFGNMFSMAGASLFLPFLPLLPKQILLTNLLTDLPEMAISTDRVELVNMMNPQRWELGFIKRFMVTFGLLSSVFDYLMFGILLSVLHAREKAFQTGWFLESVISAILIVLVVRTRIPFFKSLPGKYLAIATIFVLLLVLALPFTPLFSWFGFTRLPVIYYGWMLLIITGYLCAAEFTKYWFYKKIITLKHEKAR